MALRRGSQKFQTMIQDAFFISGFLLVVGIILAVIAWGSWGDEL